MGGQNDENDPENSNCYAFVRLFPDLWRIAAGRGSRKRYSRDRGGTPGRSKGGPGEYARSTGAGNP